MTDNMKKTEAGDVVKGEVAGLIGGLVASFVMSEYQSLLSKLAEEEKKSKKKKEQEPANVKAAEEISEAVFDHKLKKSEKEPAGEAVHYAMGATSGLIYGIASEIAPLTTAVWVYRSARRFGSSPMMSSFPRSDWQNRRPNTGFRRTPTRSRRIWFTV